MTPSLQQAQKMQILAAVYSRKERISEVASRYGISRKTLHKWKHRFKTQGSYGLVDGRIKQKRLQLEKVDGTVIDEIILIIMFHPAFGPKRIESHLNQRLKKKVPEKSIGRTSIFQFLKKNHLSRHRQRVTFARELTSRLITKGNTISSSEVYSTVAFTYDAMREFLDEWRLEMQRKKPKKDA